MMLRFTFEAGALVRRKIEKELHKNAFLIGLALTLEEKKGLLDSLFLAQIEGPPEKVKQFVERLPVEQ
jgi:hypothetical protein